MENNHKYIMSFTTGGLFVRESVTVATVFMELHDWDCVRDKVMSENLLQSRAANSAKRIYREVCSRLQSLTRDELKLLVDGTVQEQRHLLWIAVCRYYKFIADFAQEVLRERYISLKNDLHYEEFDFFFNKKAEWNDGLDAIKPTTRAKLRQVLFKMLREADLLAANNTIHAAMLSPRLLDAISQGRRQELLMFPVFESET